MPSASGWYRVTRKKPCKICAKPDWCGYSDDGVLACCMRIDVGAERTAKNGGWIHRLSDAPAATPRPRPKPAAAAPTLPCVEMNDRFKFDLTYQQVIDLASDLGVTDTSLHQLDIGFSEQHGAYTFPMRRGRGDIVGFRLRNMAGEKWAITGSHNGLFIPRHLRGVGPLVIVEGPTDTAALVSIGVDAIGRPSNTGGREDLVAYCRGMRRPIVILRDRDQPGSIAEHLTDQGASRLAADLQPNQVYICRPPAHKDVRAWVTAGATHDIVMSVLRAANEFVTGTMSDPHTGLKTAS